MIKHSLTITEATKRYTKQNRDTINKVTKSLNATLKHQQTVSREVKSILKYEEVYVEFDHAISGISETIGIARDHLQFIRLQLNMLSLGHLSPSVIAPVDLRQLLMNIQKHFPTEFRLPLSPEEQLWSLYKVLPCTTLLEYDRLVIVLSIPLLDRGKTFELYKMHTLPIPNQNNNQTNLLAKYVTRGNAIAVDIAPLLLC